MQRNIAKVPVVAMPVEIYIGLEAMQIESHSCSKVTVWQVDDAGERTVQLVEADEGFSATGKQE
jgi:hypothetical protein